MPLQAFPHEQAAEQLISADAMLAACPQLESAKCARVEVCCTDLHCHAPFRRLQESQHMAAGHSNLDLPAMQPQQMQAGRVKMQ